MTISALPLPTTLFTTNVLDAVCIWLTEYPIVVEDFPNAHLNVFDSEMHVEIVDVEVRLAVFGVSRDKTPDKSASVTEACVERAVATGRQDNQYSRAAYIKKKTNLMTAVCVCVQGEEGDMSSSWQRETDACQTRSSAKPSF